MARVHPFQTNFTKGELTPKLGGQVDLKQYANAVETLENMQVFPQGGAKRRAGTRFICEVKNSANVTRLIPFEFNVEQSYVMEFGDQYIRFFKDNGQITETAQDITAITKADPAVVTVSSHGYSNGDHVWINDVVGMTEVNGRRYTVANKTTNTFELSGVDSTDYTTYSSGGTAAKVFEISTPYTSSQLFDIQFAQSADIMYLVHPLHEPAILSRTGHTSWTLADAVFEKGPYLDANSTSTTLTSSATTVGTGRTLTASASLFASTDVGRLFKLGNGHGKITAFTSATVVTVEVLVALTSNGSTTWALGAYSNTTGFPRAVSFFEQRLVYGGSTDFPQTIWFSQSGLYNNFDVGDSSAADSFIYTIAANRVNVIRWIAPARDLIIGTAGGEFQVGRPTGEPLKPDNVNIKQQTAYGSHTIAPAQIGNTVLFVQRQQRKVREFTYRFENDAYAAPDMTILSEHITKTGIVDIEYAQEPDSIYYAIRTDGQLTGMTYQRQEEVVAWHRSVIGGKNTSCTVTVTDYDNIPVGSRLVLTKSDGTTVTFTSETAGSSSPSETLGWRPNTNNNTTADNIFTAINAHADFTVANPSANVVTITETTPKSTGFLTITSTDSTRLAVTSETHADVKSIASIAETTENQVYVIVERIINGSTVKYVEYFDPDFNVDSGLTGTVNASSTKVTALDHLEGQTVQIVIDDAVYPAQKVTNGAVTVSLPSTFSNKTITVGLGYVSTLKTLRVEAGSQAGTSQARKKRYNEIVVRLLDTVGATINGDQIPFRTSANAMGESIPTFSGDKRVTNLGWNREGQITIQQTQPLPMTVLGVTGTLLTVD